MKQSRIQCVFLGTPEFALPSLKALIDHEGIDVRALVTQPDRPAGRGLKNTAPAVKSFAQLHDIPVFQPKSIKTLSASEQMEPGLLIGSKSSAPLAEFLNKHIPLDVIICVAYGKIIPPALLSFAKAGVVNVHPSLLPRWRGAAPIQRALFAGDRKTGVSIMQIDEGLDSGPVFAMRKVELCRGHTSGQVHDVLAELGAELLLESLEQIVDGSLKALPQKDDGLTYAEKWEKKDLEVIWTESAATCERRVCASAPRPGARCYFGDSLLKIHRVREVAMPAGCVPIQEGTVVVANDAELIVACGGNSYLTLEEIQFPGKKKITASEVFRGRHLKQGDLLC